MTKSPKNADSRYINSVRDLTDAVRRGGHAWPGGYPIYFLTEDGNALCFDWVKKNFRDEAKKIADSQRGYRDASRIIAHDINWEDTDLVCAEMNVPIESAYGESEEEEEAGAKEFDIHEEGSGRFATVRASSGAEALRIAAADYPRRAADYNHDASDEPFTITWRAYIPGDKHAEGYAEITVPGKGVEGCKFFEQ